MGTVAFSMQDVLLEPYGGKILHLAVSSTTTLTALLAVGGACGLGLAARKLNRGADPYRVAGFGALAGLAAFSSVIFAAPMESAGSVRRRRRPGGFGAGLFAHGTLTASMNLAAGRRDRAGAGRLGRRAGFGRRRGHRRRRPAERRGRVPRPRRPPRFVPRWSRHRIYRRLLTELVLLFATLSRSVRSRAARSADQFPAPAPITLAGSAT